MDRRFAAIVGLAALGAAALAGCKPAQNAAPIATNSPPANMAPATNAAPATGATGVTDTADAAAAKAFVDGLYVHYKTNDSSSTTWAPMDANAKDVLDPDLMKLMAEDTRLLKGDVGVIDGDWICDCQDWTSITATSTVTEASPTAAKVSATFSDKEDTGPTPAKTDTFDLVNTPSGWRIHDMGTAEDPSLRAVLAKEIADYKSGKYKDDGGAD